MLFFQMTFVLFQQIGKAILLKFFRFENNNYFCNWKTDYKHAINLKYMENQNLKIIVI